MRAAVHQEALERLQPIFDTEMTATLRTEKRFGLSKVPQGDELVGLLVRELRQINETGILMLDVMKYQVCLLLACSCHALSLTGLRQAFLQILMLRETKFSLPLPTKANT